MLDFDKAMKISPNDIGIYIERGWASLSPSCPDFDVDAISQDKLDQILDDANNKPNFDQALAGAEKAIAIDPNSKSAYLLRSYVYDHKGEFEHALADFEKAIERGVPCEGETKKQLIRLRAKLGQY